MVTFKLDAGSDSPLKVLCLGAHSDDIEIGCGGSILRLLSEHRNVEVFWVVLASSGERDREALASAEEFLAGARGKRVSVEHFRDGFLPHQGREVKEYFERVKREIAPDLIFTHYRNDLHQDHRVVSELTWNTFREHLILEYEIVKYDGDFGNPNFFISLDRGTCTKKIDLLVKHFRSQSQHRWFTQDTFWGVMRLRGVQCCGPHDHAEAFYCNKGVL